MTDRPDTSTTAALAEDPEGQLRRQIAGRLVRRVTLGAVAVFVACGALGVFGYRERTTVAEAGGYEVRITHPAVTRGGLPADWRLHIVRSDGRPIDEAVTIETSAEYFATFDQNLQVPEPDGTSQDGELTRWVYDAPGEAELMVRLDIRTQPDARWTHEAVTAVYVGDEQVAELHYSTWIVP